MKVIIAGSRSIDDLSAVYVAAISSKFEITEVVSGNAKGVDRLGEWFAAARQIPVKLFPADWDTYGKGAGPIRNAQMAEYADALILVWDGKSSGSANMLKQAKEKGLKIYEVVV